VPRHLKEGQGKIRKRENRQKSWKVEQNGRFAAEGSPRTLHEEKAQIGRGVEQGEKVSRTDPTQGGKSGGGWQVDGKTKKDDIVLRATATIRKRENPAAWEPRGKDVINRRGVKKGGVVPLGLHAARPPSVGRGVTETKKRGESQKARRNGEERGAHLRRKNKKKRRGGEGKKESMERRNQCLVRLSGNSAEKPSPQGGQHGSVQGSRGGNKKSLLAGGKRTWPSQRGEKITGTFRETNSEEQCDVSATSQ